jgi:hypothetical protein
MNALNLDIESAPDGTVTFRLPVRGRFHVHVQTTWEPADPDRKAIFDELRRRGNPDVLRILEEVGEEALEDPEALLSYGALADAPLERPVDLPLEARERVL